MSLIGHLASLSSVLFLTESRHFLLGSDLGNHIIWDSVDFSSRVLRAVSIFSSDLPPGEPCEGPDKVHLTGHSRAFFQIDFF